MKMVGAPGTLWGDPGYDVEQSTSMWPFPYENSIKAKMAAYSATGISGQRGFCAGNSLDGSPQTLTKYIWEYLGNQIPPNIYNVGAVEKKGRNTSAPKLSMAFENSLNFYAPSVISYWLPKSGSVNLSIYNSEGRTIKTLVNNNEQSGKHSVDWDSKNLTKSSGVYFICLKTEQNSLALKSTLFK